MNPDNLIKMSNQIGAFFEAMPDREQAVKDVAAHIQNVWEPRMRATLLEHVARLGDAELKTVVRDALPLLNKTI
jgi:formate dehydrogenase subunit delta